jgi:hypothetical protein
MSNELTQGRIKLLLLALVFLGPLALSFILYYGVSDWRPEGSTENGELLAPTVLSDDALLTDSADGKISKFRVKWSLVYVIDGPCDESCLNTLYETRQIRRSMGRDMERIQRIYIVTDGQPNYDFLASEHPDLIIASPESAASRDFIATAGDIQQGDVYLVDPLGNLMMRFPAELGMKKIKEDLVHLLKVSRIG